MVLCRIVTIITWSLLLAFEGYGKYVNDKVKLRMNFDDLSNYEPGRRVMMDGLHYVTHFACEIGRCQWEIRIRAVNPARAVNRANGNRDFVIDTEKFSPVQEYGVWNYFNTDDPDMMALNNKKANINMRVILDAEWEEKNLSRHTFSPKLAGKECMGDIRSRLTRDISVPLSGEWSKELKGTLVQKARPHHWYFVLEDCQGNFIHEFSNQFGIKPHAYLPHVQFEYELTLINSDGSHFGYEYWNLPEFTLIVAIIASIIFIAFIKKQLSRESGSDKSHPVVQAVNISLMCLIVFLWTHWIHYLKFKGDGIGMPFLDGYGHIMRYIGNIALMICVFAVALGYSLHVPEMTIPGEAFLALAICYGFVEIILDFAQYKTNTLRFHIHASEGVITLILGIFRVLICIAFVISCETTRRRSDIMNDSVKIFLRKFTWRGIFMMSSTPFIIFTVTTLAPKYHQNRYIEMYCVLADLAGIVYLGFAFLSSRTSFFKASVMGNSLLPFGRGSPSLQNRQRVD